MITVKQVSLIFAVIGLIILLIISSTPITHYVQLKYFATFIMIFIMTYWMTGFVKHSIYYSSVITLVVLISLPYLCDGKKMHEHFDTKAAKAKSRKKDQVIKENEDVDVEVEGDEDTTSIKTKETFDTNDHKLLNIDINVNSDDEIENARGLKSYNDPYIAQKETYRLIDTVKQLKDATNSLAPILKEGKGVMAAFKNLNLKF
jgi:hypothetical protein